MYVCIYIPTSLCGKEYIADKEKETVPRMYCMIFKQPKKKGRKDFQRANHLSHAFNNAAMKKRTRRDIISKTMSVHILHTSCM